MLTSSELTFLVWKSVAALSGAKTESDIKTPRSFLLTVGRSISTPPSPLSNQRDLADVSARAGGDARFCWMQERLRSGAPSSRWREECCISQGRDWSGVGWWP